MEALARIAIRIMLVFRLFLHTLSVGFNFPVLPCHQDLLSLSEKRWDRLARAACRTRVSSPGPAAPGLNADPHREACRPAVLGLALAHLNALCSNRASLALLNPMAATPPFKLPPPPRISCAYVAARRGRELCSCSAPDGYRPTNNRVAAATPRT